MNLLEAWPQKMSGVVAMTTYTFDPALFENYLLSVLLDRGAEQVVIFVDYGVGFRQNVETLASLHQVGRAWSLIPVRHSHPFHPKVHYFPRAGVALVGSGNLTWTGCGGNLEAFEKLTSPEDGAALAQVHDFFRKLLANRAVQLGQAARQSWTTALGSGRAAGTGDAVFLHTLAGGLHKPLVNALFDAPAAGKAVMAAPFHDHDHHTTRRLWADLGKPQLSVAAERANPLPKKSWAPKRFEPTSGRSGALHAKVIHLATPDWSFQVTGSANLTTAGFGGKNIEAVVLRQHLDPAAFDEFLGKVTLEDAVWGAPDIEQTEGGVGVVNAAWARLIGSVIEVEADGAPNTTFTLVAGSQSAAAGLQFDGDVWRGRSPFLPTRGAVVRVHQPGLADAVLVLDNPHRGSLSRRHRIAAALRGVESGDRLIEHHYTILDTVGSLMEAMLASPDQTSTGPTPKKVTVSATTEPVRRVVPLEVVEEVLLCDPRTDGLASANLPSLERLLDRLTGRTRPDFSRIEAGPRKWSPTRLALIEDTANADEQVSETRTEESVTGRDKRKRECWYADALQVAEEIRSRLGRHPPEQRVATYRLLKTLLAGLALVDSAVSRSASWAYLGLVHDAWCCKRWPEGRAGWLHEVKQHGLSADEAIEDLNEVLDASVGEADIAAVLGDRPDQWKDLVSRTVRGLFTNPPDNGDAMHPLAQAAMTWTPRDRQAAEVLGAIWRAEEARVEWDKFKREYDALEALIEEHEATCRRVARRNKHARAAREALEDLRARHEAMTLRFRPLEERYHSTFYRFRDLAAGQRASARGAISLDQAYKTWKVMRPRPMGTNVRRVLSPKDGICRCTFQLLADQRQALRDPRAIVQCEHCRRLVLAGPDPETSLDV